MGSFGILEWILFFCLSYLIFNGLRVLTETESDRSYFRLVELLNITKEKKTDDSPTSQSVFIRIYKLLESTISNVVSEQIRKGNLSNLDLRLKQAGLKTNSNDFWTRVVVYALIGSFVGLLAQSATIALVLAIVGALIPFYRLRNLIQKRQFDLLNHLPDFLDLVAVTFPATSNIEQTFESVCERYDNIVSREFKIAVDELRLGRNKKVVYQELVSRTGLDEISTLISQINQAESFGTGLEDVLLSQSKSIRHAKKVMAEKKGSQAKMLIYIPMMITMVIALLIIAFPFAMPLLENFGSFM